MLSHDVVVVFVSVCVLSSRARAQRVRKGRRHIHPPIPSARALLRPTRNAIKASLTLAMQGRSSSGGCLPRSSTGEPPVPTVVYITPQLLMTQGAFGAYTRMWYGVPIHPRDSWVICAAPGEHTSHNPLSSKCATPNLSAQRAPSYGCTHRLIVHGIRPLVVVAVPGDDYVDPVFAKQHLDVVFQAFTAITCAQSKENLSISLCTNVCNLPTDSGRQFATDMAPRQDQPT